MKQSLLYAFLLMGGIAGAQNINFPDINFKNTLLSATVTNYIARGGSGYGMVVDANGDGEIDQNEALQVTQLNVQYSNITSLDGIEYFQNLEQLHCRGNQITSLSLSLPSLTLIMAYNNAFTTFDVSGCPNLTYLDIQDNQLASIGVPPSLQTFACGNNLLTSLDASSLTSLEHLYCGGNQIASLNTTGLSLQSLSISGNPLPAFDPSLYPTVTTLECSSIGSTNLNLTGLTGLEYLTCSGNLFTALNTNDLIGLKFMELKNSQLTHLDLSHSPGILYVHIADNSLLESINLHNGGVTEYSGECDFTNNPHLDYICVDEGEQASLQNYFDGQQLAAPTMDSACAFLGLSDFTATAIQVYPNPSKDIVTITSGNDILGIELYDIQGRIVQDLQINSTSAQLDLTDRQSGIYLLKINTTNGVMVKKVIKQ
jgi:hypothetical protein